MCGALPAAAFALLFTICAPARAQEQAYSSSADVRYFAEPEGLAPEPSPQYGQPRRPYDYRPRSFNHFAAEFGGGFTAPGGDQPDVTYGWNVTAGVGYKFTRNFSILGEWQFNRNKIPGSTLAAVGEPGGYVKTWSLTLDPVLSYKFSDNLGGYFTGGGGFYRKVTSFTEPGIGTGYYCDYFFCYPYQYQTNVVVSHFSSNQGGLNIGGGLTFGNWSGGKFYTEARYVWLDTPGRSTKLVPVTFGYRW